MSSNTSRSIPATVLGSLFKLREEIKVADEAMQGDQHGDGARPPDGDDYNSLYRRVMDALAELDTGDRPITRVVVTLEGGLVSGMNADHAGIQVLVKDYDAEGTGCTHLPQDSEGVEYCVNDEMAYYNPSFVEETIQQVAAASAAEDADSSAPVVGEV